jgi:predicted nucleic acid-binding protein
MILADTSIWVDHLRRSDLRLAQFLDHGDVVTHPFVIGELALGYVPRIAETLRELRRLPMVTVAGTEEVLGFIAHRKLSGSGIGYVDVHLLAAAALAQETFLWTRDKRLHTVAQSLSLAAEIQE